MHVQLGPGDRKHYKKTTLTYLRGYAVDETPVHADLIPPCPPSLEDAPSQTCRSNVNAESSSKGSLDKSPKWLANDRKVSQCLPHACEAQEAEESCIAI